MVFQRLFDDSTRMGYALNSISPYRRFRVVQLETVDRMTKFAINACNKFAMILATLTWFEQGQRGAIDWFGSTFRLCKEPLETILSDDSTATVYLLALISFAFLACGAVYNLYSVYQTAQFLRTIHREFKISNRIREEEVGLFGENDEDVSDKYKPDGGIFCFERCKKCRRDYSREDVKEIRSGMTLHLNTLEAPPEPFEYPEAESLVPKKEEDSRSIREKLKDKLVQFGGLLAYIICWPLYVLDYLVTIIRYDFDFIFFSAYRWSKSKREWVSEVNAEDDTQRLLNYSKDPFRKTYRVCLRLYRRVVLRVRQMAGWVFITIISMIDLEFGVFVVEDLSNSPTVEFTSKIGGAETDEDEKKAEIDLTVRKIHEWLTSGISFILDNVSQMSLTFAYIAVTRANLTKPTTSMVYPALVTQLLLFAFVCLNLRQRIKSEYPIPTGEHVANYCLRKESFPLLKEVLLVWLWPDRISEFFKRIFKGLVVNIAPLIYFVIYLFAILIPDGILGLLKFPLHLRSMTIPRNWHEIRKTWPLHFKLPALDASKARPRIFKLDCCRCLRKGSTDKPGVEETVYKGQPPSYPAEGDIEADPRPRDHNRTPVEGDERGRVVGDSNDPTTADDASETDVHTKPDEGIEGRDRFESTPSQPGFVPEAEPTKRERRVTFSQNDADEESMTGRGRNSFSGMTVVPAPSQEEATEEKAESPH